MENENVNENVNDNVNNEQNSYTFWAEQAAQNQQGNCNFTIPPVEPPKKERKHTGAKFFRFTGKAVAFGAIAAIAFFGVNSAFDKYQESKIDFTTVSSSDKINVEPPTSTNAISSTVTSTSSQTNSTDISDIIDSTMPSIVAITSTIPTQGFSFFGQEYSNESTGSGSGIIIGKNENEMYIATNNHVVEDANKIEVTFIDGETVAATVRGHNSSADLAVLAISMKDIKDETLDEISVAKIGDSDNVKVGQMAIAIGNALGYGQSVTVGYISAKDREVTNDNNVTLSVLQTDAAINPGNSGGALININGEVIGINSAKLASTQVEGIGYAIPISQAFPIVDDLMNREVVTEEQQGYLGVYLKDINTAYAQVYGWPVGAYVSEVVEGGAAKKAGIYAGDIITGVNDVTVSDSEALHDEITSYKYGTTVTITLMRLTDGEYKEQKIDVTLQQNNTNK